MFQIIPAVSEYHNGPPQFDSHAFAGRRAKAVSAETHLSFADFKHMHVGRRSAKRERRLPTPEWVSNDALFREIIVRYLEQRFFVHPDLTATLTERLRTAEQAGMKQIAHKQRQLEEMLAKWPHCTPAKRADLEIEIQNRDSELVLLRRGIASVVVACAYLYHRMGWNSVQIARHVDVKPPFVRTLLYRLDHVANGTPKWRSKKKPKPRRWPRPRFVKLERTPRSMKISFSQQPHVARDKRVRWTEQRVAHVLELKKTRTWAQVAKLIGYAYPSTLITIIGGWQKRKGESGLPHASGCVTG